MTNIDIKQLKEIIKLCKKEGIQSVTIGDISLTLNPHYKKPSRSRPKEDKIENEIQYTEEDTLFWSSAGLNNA